MAIPLLETKLHVPAPRRGLVARPRLRERLSRITGSKLALISAPAGFGKSTLVADWLAATARGRQLAAWTSLDESDNEPMTFWTYLIAALRTVASGIGVGSLSQLESSQPRVDGILAPLLNDLGALPRDVVLVLDDYHLIDAPDIQDGMAYFIDHLPPAMHLVIATRADPALPLARLRARGELVEIRAADLRFTPDEAAAYFNDVLALGLDAKEVAALEGRTEGWIAALQLAGLTMQGRGDVADFVAGFAGDDRYVVDYLVEEVLHRQTEDVQSFLLRTSILTRMTGSLCDAVTGQDGGRATLEALDRANLFLVSLDDRRQWYRYHQLFADVLQARLLDERPAEVPELHRRASEWYERNGDRPDAIRHAMAGEDFARAADLVELALPELRQNRQEAIVRQWLDALPDELIRVRPVLSNEYAGVLLRRGEIDGVDARLRDAERWLEGADEARDGVVVVDEGAYRSLPGAIAMHRAGHALLVGEVAAAMAHAQRALELAGEDEHLVRGGAAGLLGLACWTRGDLEAASRWYADATISLERAGLVSDAIGLSLAAADVRLAQGRLSEAMAIYERGLRLATEPGQPVRRGAADMHVGISDILRERNDLAAAAEQLRKAKELGEENGLPQNRHRSRVAEACLRHVEGDVDGALGLLDEAKRLYFGDFSPDVRPIPALRAKVLILAGRLPDAVAWARNSGLSAADDLSYVHEFEHVILARVLLEQAKQGRGEHGISDLRAFLERLLEAAESGGRMGSAIEILLLQALADHADGNTDAALASLERAIGLAAPEGYVRTFVDEGAPMTALLRLAARRRMAPDYLSRLLAASGSAAGQPTGDQPLIEPLSERELEVLRLLNSELDGPGIARELVVSLNTVRTHTRNIYAKLGVNSRRAAVRRAAELGLLERAGARRSPE